MHTLMIAKPSGDLVAQTVVVRRQLLALAVPKHVLAEKAKLLGKGIVLQLGLKGILRVLIIVWRLTQDITLLDNIENVRGLTLLCLRHRRLSRKFQ